MSNAVELVKIEAYVRVEKIDDVIRALEKNDINGMTVTEVRGHGRQKKYSDIYRGGRHFLALIRKIHISVITTKDKEQLAIDSIVESASTGQKGDGIVFTTPVASFLRISTKATDL